MDLSYDFQEAGDKFILLRKLALFNQKTRAA